MMRRGLDLGCLLCALGFFLTLAAFYPGFLTNDSISQLHQARGLWRMGDFQPPIMALVWRSLDRIYPGPAGMLILHNLIFWCGLALIHLELRERFGRVFPWVPLLGFAPFSLGLLSTIWKDIGMGASLVLASGLILRAERTRDRAHLLAALPLIFYAVAVRWNAVVAVFPLTILIGILFSRPRKSRQRGIILGFILLGVFFFGAMGINRGLVRVKTYPGQIVQIFDLAALSIAEGSLRMPEYIKRDPTFSFEKVRKDFNPSSVNPLLWPEGSAAIRLTKKPSEAADLQAEWIKAMRENTLGWLKVKTVPFTHLLVAEPGDTCLRYAFGITPNNLGVEFHPSWLSTLMLRYFEGLGTPFWFDGQIWLLLSSICAIAAVILWKKLRTAPAALALATSSLLYCLHYFLILPSCEYRYIWWSTLASYLAAALLVTEALARRIKHKQ